MELRVDPSGLGPALAVDADGRVEPVNPAGADWQGSVAAGLALAPGASQWVERHDADGRAHRALLTALPRAGGGALLVFSEAPRQFGPSSDAMGAMLDSIPAMIGYWDASRHNRFANRAYREWFGMTPEQIAGRHIRELLGPDIYAKNLPFIEAALRGEPQQFERTIPKPDGTTVRHSSAIYVPDVDDGEVRGFSVLVFDVSELKRTQLALEEARQELEQRVSERTRELELANLELARSNRELTEFAHVASHDLQEPLRTIATYCELLQEHYQGQADARGMRYLEHTVTAARRMQALVAAVLKVSQVGGAVGPLAPFDPGEAARSAIEATRASIEATHATIVLEPLPMVAGDPIAVATVFQNLLSNAIKFSGEAPPHVTIRGRIRADMVELAVTDQGIGLDMQFANKVFSMFQRVHVGRYAGSGIGLAIVKKIIERHGGEVGVHSGPDGGATFWFTLPRGNP